MKTPTPDTVTKKKRAALRVFGDSLALDYKGAIDDSLTYSTGSVASQARNSTHSENGENEPNTVTMPEFQTVPMKEQASFTNVVDKHVTFSLPEKQENETTVESQTVARNVFQSIRSPLRPDLVRRTQEAIRMATIGVNETMLLGKSDQQSRKQSNKSRSTVDTRTEWQSMMDEAREFNDQLHASRLRMLALKKQVSSEGSREKAIRFQEHRSRILAEMDKESQFKSLVYREHQKRLREEEERRRRMSIADRTKLRNNAAKGKERMKLQRIEEETALVEERHEFTIALQEKKKQDAESRRNSLKFRGKDAQRIREVQQLMEVERQQQAQASYSLKEQDNKQVDEYKRKLNKDRRDSFANRNKDAFHQRKQEMERQAQEYAAEHESYQLKFAGHRDVDSYMKQQRAEKRQSFQERGKIAQQVRSEEEARIAAELEAEHMDFEFKRRDFKDVGEYRKEVAEDRRKSFEKRGEQHRRARKAIANLQSKEKQAAHDAFEAKMAGLKDADEYEKKLAKARRESLASRNKLAHKQRNTQQEKEAEAKLAEHQDFELKRAGAADVRAYNKSLRDEKRKSLHGRNVERVNHARVMSELHQIAQEKESESYALKWSAERDAKEYLAKLEEERRESLQLRGKQIVHGRKVEEEERTKELIQLHEDEKLKEEDQKAVNEYKAQCASRDRSSLEYRWKEFHRQRLEQTLQNEAQHQKDSDDFQLDSMARKDAEEYLKECRRRRRMSLANRAKEKRQHVQWKRQKEEQELRERRQLVHGRLMDQRYIELARQEEKAKKALEDIRHAARTNNPFSGLL